MVEKKLPSLGEIRKAIPKECFEKSLPMSLYYMFRDIGIMTFLYTLFYPYVEEKYGLAGKVVYWNLQGFFMWCLFVVGHDCGHTSFSKYQTINDICGHVCHSILLVPYWPWQKSHRLHHMYHNHLTKDMSHPWFTKELYDDLNSFEEALLQNPLTLFIKYSLLYLFMGKRDGSHINPFGVLFETNTERLQCFVSTITVILAGYGMWLLTGENLTNYFNLYLAPLMVFNVWITMVTYLQHHDEDTVVYDEGEWNYVKGAVETIDRKYGFGIDDIHHNISDGHVAHHLFFTGIPHYNLKKATEAIKKVLEPTGMYKCRETYNFLGKVTELNYKLKWLEGDGKILRYHGMPGSIHFDSKNN